jgi:integrase
MKRGRSKSAPAYRLHKATGQARVTLNGKTHYLGAYNTPGSLQKYHRLIADHWHPPGTAHKPAVKTSLPDVTVSRLAIEFGKFARSRYSGTGEWRRIQRVLKVIRETCGDLPANEFGAIRFENFRQSVVQAGYSRSEVKRRAGYVLRMFEHGVRYELIPVELHQRLKSVGPVEMNGKPPKKVLPVDDAVVRATQAELTPVVADMVEVQWLTGMRPGEVCNLRPCDIDRCGDVWIYTPPTHKTQRYGKERQIPIGPRAQAVLKRYLLRDQRAFCFCPGEAYEQHFQRRRENRTTPDGYGNGPSPRKRKSFQPKYNKDTYRRAVERAALRAFPIPAEIAGDGDKVVAWKRKHVWKPNQLRHTAATTARQEYDLETAQLVLGHSSKQTTERFYAELDLSRAIEFARKCG